MSSLLSACCASANLSLFGCGLLSASAAVSSAKGIFIWFIGLSFSPGGSRSLRNALLFFCLCDKPLSFQPAYAASLCSLVDKELCEPMSPLTSRYSCKPDSRSSISPNYFVVSFAHLRSEPLSCSCGR